jgi:hypothetical protein
VAAFAFAITAAVAGEHQHPAVDKPLHEKFYSTWYMPVIRPSRAATSSTAARPRSSTSALAFSPGDVGTDSTSRYRRRKSSGTADNPDGRNHVCTPPPNHSQAGYVFCFLLGGGI